MTQIRSAWFFILWVSACAPVAGAMGDFFGRVQIGETVYAARLKDLDSGRYFRISPFPPAEGKNTEGPDYPLSEGQILVPTTPTKIFGAVSNYKGPDYDPAKKPKNPQFFLKAPSALLPHEGTIILPEGGDGAVYEAEMVVVIGKRAENVSVEDAPGYVFGVTCGNDVSGVGWEDDFQLWRAKGADTFAPCGPFVATGLDYSDLAIELRVNGETRQKGRTSGMIFSVAEQISFISRFVTLEPGDLIYTGTPGPIGKLNPGDSVEVVLEGVGVLRNTVIREK